MVQWVTDTYGAEFAALLPSYEKMKSLGLLESEKRKEN
jgi:hypothetical protein